MNQQDRDEFLNQPRYAVITTLTRDGRPVSVPVWYEWNGSEMLMFSTSGTGKIKRLRKNPFATILVVNDLSEQENWVSMDGTVVISDEGGDELAQRLTTVYWDLSDPERKAEAEAWKDIHFQLLTFRPDQIKSYS
jgi:PPOX class probable F420-dependent enzyme